MIDYCTLYLDRIWIYYVQSGSYIGSNWVHGQKRTTKWTCQKTIVAVVDAVAVAAAWTTMMTTIVAGAKGPAPTRVVVRDVHLRDVGVSARGTALKGPLGDRAHARSRRRQGASADSAMSANDPRKMIAVTVRNGGQKPERARAARLIALEALQAVTGSVPTRRLDRHAPALLRRVHVRPTRTSTREASRDRVRPLLRALPPHLPSRVRAPEVASAAPPLLANAASPRRIIHVVAVPRDLEADGPNAAWSCVSWLPVRVWFLVF